MLCLFPIELLLCRHRQDRRGDPLGQYLSKANRVSVQLADFV